MDLDKPPVEEDAAVQAVPVSESEQQKRVQLALEKYNRKFFTRFAFTGSDASRLTQIALEEHILKEQDPEEVRLLALALVNSAYQLNDLIPNIELVFYKIFCSPITTKEERKGEEDLLVGNLFAREGMNLGSAVYRSLLETVALHPKKKHYKKIIQHMLKFEEV